jgi:hypothetical protein
VGFQAAPAEQAVSESAENGLMEVLNTGYLQLALVALVLDGLQIWWITSTLRK